MFPGPLRVYREIVRRGSIRKAGDALSLAPSSVSRQLAILERQVGTRLLDRTPTGVILTHAGRLVAEFSHSVLSDFDSLESDLNDLRGQRRGLIRLATVESIAAPLPAQVIQAFHQRFPAVAFQVRVLPAPAVIEAVRNGEVEVGASFCPEPDAAMSVVARLAEPIVAAIPPGHPFAARTSLTLAELADAPLAVPDRDFRVRSVLERAFHSIGQPLAPMLVSNAFATLRAAVRINGFIALLPRSSLHGTDAVGLAVVGISDSAVQATAIDFLALRHRRQSMLQRHFIKVLRTTVTDWDAPSEVMCAD